MKTTAFTCITVATVMLTGVSLRAGVAVDSGKEKEKVVAFRVNDTKYVTANTGGALDLSGIRMGSKQTFTLIDLNGGELEDGDAVKIRYTPNSSGKPDPTKSSYWAEVKEGIRRIHDADTYKIKKVDAKYAFQTSSGKFIGAPMAGGALGLTDKQADAMLVEIVDLSGGIPKKKKTADQPAVNQPAAPAAPAPDKPGADKPADQKPASE